MSLILWTRLNQVSIKEIQKMRKEMKYLYGIILCRDQRITINNDEDEDEEEDDDEDVEEDLERDEAFRASSS